MSNDPELIYLDILETILTATLDSQQWKPVLQKLSLLTGHQYATLLFYDKGNAQLISDLFLIDDKVFTAYRDVFLSIDPAEKILTGLPVGQMYRDREFLGDSFISKSTYYNEFHYPNNLNNVTSVKLCTANGNSTYLSLLRTAMNCRSSLLLSVRNSFIACWHSFPVSAESWPPLIPRTKDLIDEQVIK
jgi:hypothetical protein